MLDEWSGNAPPLQFTEEAIEFRNGELKLGGDLLLPAGPGPHPAIVLIHGSGKATRDDLRIFASLFVSHGVAALLYDKRDVGADPSGMDLVDHYDLLATLLPLSRCSNRAKTSAATRSDYGAPARGVG
jgi:fermentation-respiration switch protein FrsA (DUF1100 family)